MILDIIKVGDERLRKISEEVKVVDDEVLRLIKNMKSTLKKSKGVGLAAPQVGINKRIIIVKPQSEMFAFINPVITYKGGSMVKDTEGCLSVPNTWVDVERFSEVELEFTGEDGDRYKVKAEDFFARIIQHECDHLDGVLIIDKEKK